MFAAISFKPVDNEVKQSITHSIEVDTEPDCHDFASTVAVYIDNMVFDGGLGTEDFMGIYWESYYLCENQ